MKIRTADHLYDALSQELAWRKKELITLKFLHDQARAHQQEMLRRAGVAMLYAHWEGFVKSAGTAYVELVAHQGLRYQELESNFVAIAARQQIRQFSETSRGSTLCDVSEFFLNKSSGRAEIGTSSAIQTKSNLSARVMRDIVRLLGLDYRPFEIHEKTVIEPLRERRNSVAHGKYLAVQEPEYHELHEKVLQLMEEMGSQISTAAFNGAYRRGNSSAP